MMAALDVVVNSNKNEANRFGGRIRSEPYKFEKNQNNSNNNNDDDKIGDEDNDNNNNNNNKSIKPQSSAFPKTFTYSGYLDLKTGENKEWKRRYFVLNNNFLLCAATPYAQKLENAICLEGSNTHTKSSDMTFELIVKKKNFIFRAPNPKECEQWTQHIERASTLKIKDIYQFLSTLGTSESQNTKVVAARHRVTKEESAIKIVNKKTCDQKMLKTEIQVLKKLNSIYIVQLLDIFETKKFLYIVMEKCDGGELFDQIADLDGDHYNESDCCNVMHQIAKGVQYMHDNGIVHRDLKPENILCVKRNSIELVKIADFGISKVVKHGSQQMNTMVGTLSYTAPEILKGKSYDKTVDYWSIGVIMYILLSGSPPFWGESEQEITKDIINGDIEFDDEDWDHVSEETKNLVKGLLNRDPKKRRTTQDIINLAWKVSAKTQSFKKAHKNFKKHVTERKLHRISMGVLEGNSSKEMKRFYPNKDDMSQKQNNHKPMDHSFQYNSKNGKRGSKVEEDLHANHLESINPNDPSLKSPSNGNHHHNHNHNNSNSNNSININNNNNNNNNHNHEHHEHQHHHQHSNHSNNHHSHPHHHNNSHSNAKDSLKGKIQQRISNKSDLSSSSPSAQSSQHLEKKFAQQNNLEPILPS